MDIMYNKCNFARFTFNVLFDLHLCRQIFSIGYGASKQIHIMNLCTQWNVDYPVNYSCMFY